MGTEELKIKFGELIPLLQEINAISKNIEKRQNKQALLYRKKDVNDISSQKTGIVVAEVLIGLCLFPIALCFLLIMDSYETLMLFLIVLITLLAVTIYGLIKINKYLFSQIQKKDEEKRRILNEEFEQKEKELNHKRERLQELLNIVAGKINVVPPNYQYLMAIEYMYSYFCNGRADNLKEAVNLYEEELFRMRQEQRSEQLVELQAQQSYDISRMQQAATVTAIATSVNAVNNIMRK